MIEPREWQAVALYKFLAHDRLSFLLEATPGAGKTIFSALCAQKLIEDEGIDFCLIVVPTTALKGDRFAGFKGDWHKVGIQLTPVLKDGRGAPREYDGAVVTYQQLPNLITTIETWAASGVRLFVAFDEVHHTTESNVWGAAAERLARSVERNNGRILAMTGTPFRGDGQRISFVEYDERDVAKAHHSYTYRDAVADKVCRSVQFITDDGMAEFIRDQEERGIRISEAAAEDDVRDAANTIFRGDSRWLETTIEKADACLEEYRAWDADAAGLIVCRPGADENDDRHLHQVASLVRKITGEEPEVVSHADGPDANAKIERFRSGSSRWICAVRKISEGVDIKRLRVEVMANRPTTELLFRQMVGRVVRVDDPDRPGDATVYLAKFPTLCEWAARISDEAEAGLREREARDAHDIAERGQSSFVAVGSSHEDGGLISDFGENYSPAEIAAAERLIRNDPQLTGLPLQHGLRLLRKAGFRPDPTEPATEPLHDQKRRLREEIIRNVRKVAIRRNPTEPDFKGVQLAVWKRIGVKSIDDLVESHSIDVMRQALNILHVWLAGKDEAA